MTTMWASSVLLALVCLTRASWGDVVTPTPTASLIMKRLADSQSDDSEPTPVPATQKPAVLARPEMYSLHVTSHIEYRFANTLITSRLANPAASAQEIFFSVVIPETAFISKFSMEVQGKVYEAYVKEKEAAKQEYDTAVAAGQGAAHVALSARDSNRFTVSVNIEPMSKVTFNLTYEELLTRRLGAYNHVVNLDPGQIVRDLKVDVYIKESRNLTLLRVPELRSGNEVDADKHSKANPLATVERTSPREAHVSFTPTAEQQKQLGKIKPIVGDDEEGHGDVQGQASTEAGKDEGLGGQFVVQYDVDRDPLAGEVLVNDGFFVHFFAPKDLPPLRKHALFVLDVSGSMEGRKIDQLKEAMDAILDDLQPGDYFNIIEFSYSVTVWNLDSAAASAVFSPSNSYHYDAPAPNPGPTPAFPATAEYVAKAKEIVKKMRAGGGTNIYDTLKTVIRVAHTGLENITVSDNTTRTPLIVFLTDGEPTVGETRLPKIFSVVQELNSNPQAAIFSLAFGDDADLGFLKTLSLRNSGFARKIYEASDAALQLRDFYRQIASPLLTNVTFDYVPEKVVKESTTKVNFHTLFSGAELVVAGKLRRASPDSSRFDGIAGEVHGLTSTGESTMLLPTPIDIDIVAGVPTAPKEPTSLERLWAYLTIKQLLEKDDLDSGDDDESDKDKKNDTSAISPKKQALELALKYSFVTPLTSLVVVKPNEAVNKSQAVDPVDGTKNSEYAAGAFAGNFAAFAGAPVDRISSGIPLALGGPVGAPHYMTQAHRPMSPMTTTYYPIRGSYGGGGGGGGGGHSVQLAGDVQPAPVFESAQFEEEEETYAELQTTESPTDVSLVTLEQLDWLDNVKNGSDVILPFGPNNKMLVLHLKVSNETSVDLAAHCSTPEGQPGECVHLVACSLSIFQHDISEYKPFFCQINNYAGTCCPMNLVAPSSTSEPPEHITSLPDSSTAPVASSTSAVPATSNTSAVPVTSNTSAVPVTSSTSAVPVTSKTSAVPVTSKTSAVPVTSKTSSK